MSYYFYTNYLVVKMKILNRLNYVEFVDIKMRVQHECVLRRNILIRVVDTVNLCKHETL